MKKKTDSLEKYICQLIEDLDEIAKNPPVGAYFETPPHLEESPEIAELALTPFKTIEEITGISIDSFPESYKLDGLQIQRVNAAIFRVFNALNFALIDAPADIPPEMLYDVLTMNWDFYVQHLPTAGMDLEFCTGNPQDCPYGFYCSCFKDSGIYELLEKYEAVIPNIASCLNEGLVCYLDTSTLEVETIEESIVTNPLNNLHNEKISFVEFDLMENLWDCKIIFFPLGTQQIYEFMADFATHQEPEIYNKLSQALNSKRIFSEFYFVINSSGCLQNWKDFLQMKTELHIREILTDKLYDPFSGSQEEINGLFNDDDTKIDLDTIPLPEKCLTCRSFYSDNDKEDQLCKLTRNNQQNRIDFQCDAYESI